MLPEYCGSLRRARESISNPGRDRVLTQLAFVVNTRRFSGAFHPMVNVLFAPRSLEYFRYQIRSSATRPESHVRPMRSHNSALGDAVIVKSLLGVNSGGSLTGNRWAEMTRSTTSLHVTRAGAKKNVPIKSRSSAKD